MSTNNNIIIGYVPLIMGRKENSYGHTNIDKYRKQLGKQEFKGRSKKHTIAEKNRAQSRSTESSYLQTVLLYCMIILVSLLAIYALFYAMLQTKPKDGMLKDKI
ncbi:triple QxxK/R motif-containing protein-like [Xenia sp. Carnegie-2017]|uniref:triple QxxK/R motif-containing protein-like n=1 Tax=Xenia sp. Carnegie-2017 TaxID=2897299 RepID=UPI001F03B9D8|nr:triple QxxK/R motif-containing protein-like [Xenia sp. Carnegie-2017]